MNYSNFGVEKLQKAVQFSLERLLFILVSGGLSNLVTVERRVLVFPSPVLMMFA